MYFPLPSLTFIQFDENEQHGGEAEQRGASVTDEWQRDADDGHQADGHADVDDKVEEDDRGDAVAVVLHEGVALFFRQCDDAENEVAEEAEDEQTAHKAHFFANAAEYKIGALLGHEVVLGLGAVADAFAEKASRADGNLRLGNVEVDTRRVGRAAEEAFNTLFLVGFQNVLVCQVDGENERNAHT